MAKKITTKKNIDGKEKEGDEVEITSIGKTFAGKKNVRSIDELLGRNNSPYTSETYESYENRINGFSTSDLERHATEMGVFPTSNRSILKKRLLNEFRKVSGGYFNTIQSSQGVQGKNPDKLIEVLSKGRN